jgi:hypothetical protein
MDLHGLSHDATDILNCRFKLMKHLLSGHCLNNRNGVICRQMAHKFATPSYLKSALLTELAERRLNYIDFPTAPFSIQWQVTSPV